MSVRFSCSCGQELAAESSDAGTSVLCPRCGASLEVPSYMASHADDASPMPVARPWEKGADPDNPFAFTTPADNARQRERQVREQSEASGGSFEGNILNGGAIIGLLAMIGAVAWFVIGLAVDIIFFYPPILFIIGLISFFKGLAQGPGSD